MYLHWVCFALSGSRTRQYSHLHQSIADQRNLTIPYKCRLSYGQSDEEFSLRQLPRTE